MLYVKIEKISILMMSCLIVDKNIFKISFYIAVLEMKQGIIDKIVLSSGAIAKIQ